MKQLLKVTNSNTMSDHVKVWVHKNCYNSTTMSYLVYLCWGLFISVFSEI